MRQRLPRKDSGAQFQQRIRVAFMYGAPNMQAVKQMSSNFTSASKSRKFHKYEDSGVFKRNVRSLLGQFFYQVERVTGDEVGLTSAIGNSRETLRTVSRAQPCAVVPVACSRESGARRSEVCAEQHSAGEEGEQILTQRCQLC